MPLKRYRPVQSHPAKRIVRLRHIVGGRRRRWCRGTANGRIHTRTERGSSHTLGRRRNNHIVFRILEAGVLADKAQAHIAHGTVTVLGDDDLRHTMKIVSFFILKYLIIFGAMDKGNDLHGMAEIIIAKHRNGAVGEVLLRFKGEFTRFSNPEDDMVIPMPGETVGPMLGSKMNRDSVGSVPPPPAPDFEPQSGNPFATPIGGDGPLPF